MPGAALFQIVVVSVVFTLGARENGASSFATGQASAPRDEVVRQRTIPSPADLARMHHAAEQGDAIAQNALGLLYASGSGVTRDPVQAFHWFQMSAAQGFAKAQFNEGEAYAAGSGVLQDAAAAFESYLKAAIQGLAEAQYAVGSAYAESRGVWGDDVLAYQWFLKSAAQGYALAELAVGEAYAFGTGVPPSDERAFPWLRHAAEQGLARAQYMYGMRHPRGALGDDIAVAAEWLRKAAEQDYAPAQYVLGTLYQSGSNDYSLIAREETKAIFKDYVEADRWFSICWNRSSGEIAGRCGVAVDELERRMSRDDVFEAQTRATEWMHEFDSRQQ